MINKKVLRLITLALAAALLLSLTPAVSSAKPNTALSGELTVLLQAYYDPTVDKDTAAIAEDIAKQYMVLHPDVKITLIPNLPTTTDIETYLTARMAANQSPDIMWEQFGPRNLHADTWWLPLNKYFDMPNPYIAAGTKGHDKWSDSFPDYVVSQTRAADGNWYEVALDWVETGLYYNKDLFAKAGVDPTKWKSWGNFISDMKTVKDKTGVDPVGMFAKQTGWSNWWWTDDIFLTVAWADIAKSIYMDKYNDKNRPWRQLNPEEIAKAIIDGKLNATDKHMDSYLKLSKDFISLLPIDYTSIPGLDDLDKLFFSAQVASVWTGTWKNKPYSTGVPFNYGVTYLPAFTTADAPSAQNTAYRVGGPTSAGQFGIAQSAVKAGKEALAADFLMYLSAPQNIGRSIKTLGGYIPMVAGAEKGATMLGFSDVAALPERMFNDPDSRLTLETADLWSQAMQGYFLGKTDEAATKTALQKIWMDGAKSLCAKQKYDWCPKA